MLVLSNVCDRFFWCSDSSGLFSVASAWNLIRVKKDRVPWVTLVWDNALAPRYQFLLWLIAKKRLPTQSLLLFYGRIDYSVCAFCSTQPDSIDHLFFHCQTLATLAYFWASRCNLPWRIRPWTETSTWALKFLSGKDFFHKIARFSFGALCYLIWKKRNCIIFYGETVSVSALKNHLIKVVNDRVLSFKNVPPTPRNRRLQRNWGFDPSVFSR